MTGTDGQAAERFLECCRAVAEGRPVVDDRHTGPHGQRIVEARAGCWRLRTTYPGFGLGLAAAVDDDGATLAMFHASPGAAMDMFSASRRGETVELARLVAGHFSDPVLMAGAWHPSADLDLATARRDVAIAIMGAVVEALPDSSFASAMVQWGPSGCFASIGCDEPIGDPRRPLLTESFEASILGMRAPLTLREGSAWESVADHVIPDLKDLRQRDVVVIDATLETQVERDALSYLRAIADGRDALARLAVPVGERILQPPI